MQIPEELLTLFSARVESRNGGAVIEVPDRELSIGDVELDETYRIAVLPQSRNATDGDAPQASSDDRSSDQSDAPVEEGEQLDVEIEDVGDQGDGIARIGPGYIVFVSDTDIGDRVTIEIQQARPNYAFGEVVEPEPLSD